ncbi:hypothetical protein DF3PB_220013 [uncultured Defluviicoccus sp.]|uniref:Uncharacterized protein n=1 Tax=metagenome TaxID=256318 RepID=A0A380TBQ1_9ZZZZ|nr:hypothetical protein DF3PB_220013 [uncultured Defluviicoccus sp.]
MNRQPCLVRPAGGLLATVNTNTSEGPHYARDPEPTKPDSALTMRARPENSDQQHHREE